MSSPVHGKSAKHDSNGVAMKRKRDPAEAPAEHHNERHSKKKKKDGRKGQSNPGDKKHTGSVDDNAQAIAGQQQAANKKKEKNRNGHAKSNGLKMDNGSSNGRAGPTSSSHPETQPESMNTKGKESRRAGNTAKKQHQKALAEGTSTSQGHGSNELVVQTKTATLVAQEGLEDSKNVKRRANVQALNNEVSKKGWKMSVPSGGRFIDQPARLSAKEDLLLCATENELQIYTTSDSLLKHSLKSPDNSAITSFSLSSEKDPVVFVSTASGLIMKWNFKNATSLGTWETNCEILDLSVAHEGEPGSDVMYSISKDTHWAIRAHQLGLDSEVEKTKTHTLLQLEKPIQSFQTLDNGNMVVAISDRSLIVGKRSSSSAVQTKEVQFAWREVECAEPPWCFDALLSSGKSFQDRKRLSVAVGGNKGAIYVYQDLLVQLGLDKKSRNSIEAGTAKPTTKLHWHREEVGSVAWSKDGNYLISGGMETVLLLWQLDTGKKQHLPHLESPVQSIAVSPSGASYVIRLGDNSVMVLSASEFKPTCHVANLQTTSLPTNYRFRPEVPRMEMWTAMNNAPEELPTIQAAISSQRPHEVLSAVSSYQRDGNFMPVLPSTPYLQTFDTLRSRHVARQALTRTMATHLNMGPDGNRIAEPDVKFLEVSANGKWMATVDEWSPHTSDLEDFTLDATDMKTIIEQQRMIQLRFWSWNEKEHTWALNTRINSPHTLEGTQAAGKVLGLVASPASSAFATIGQDSKVKLWEPKTRLPNSQVIHGESGDRLGQTSWSVRREVPLETGMTAEPFSRLLPRRASLAFAGDGSTVVANQHFDSSTQHSDSSLIHFIDVDRGLLCQSRSDIASGLSLVYDLAFLDCFLVCLGADLVKVWNVTSMEQHAQMTLPKMKARGNQSVLQPFPLLAVNPLTSTFAVAAPMSLHIPPDHSAGLPTPLRTHTSELCIYSLAETNKTPNKSIWRTKLPRLVLSLLSAGGIQGDSDASDDSLAVSRQGYVTIDAGATVRSLRPLRSVEMGTLEPAADNEMEETELEDVAVAVDQDDEGSSSEDDEDLAFGNDDDDDDDAASPPPPAQRPVVAPQQLAALFDHPAHAMPPLRELLGGVLQLYAPKRAAGAARG